MCLIVWLTLYILWFNPSFNPILSSRSRKYLATSGIFSKVLLVALIPALRENVLLHLVRHPLQGGEEQVERGPQGPHAAPEVRHEAPAPEPGTSDD